MYIIRYIDIQGAKREYLSKESDLRRAVEDFYLDECPQHISSVMETNTNANANAKGTP